jgi:hypothetical protein
MKSKKALAISVMVLACGGVCTWVIAQETLAGKYSGTYTTTGKGAERKWGLELNITSVENEKVKATLLRHGAECKGDFELEGTIKENQLVLRSNKGGRAGDCTSNLQLTVDGNKLAGKISNYAAQLSK